MKLAPTSILRLLFGIAILASCLSLRAQTNEKSVRPDLAITPEREAAARMFAKRHHPELIGLLDSLQKDMQAKYGQAIRQLYLTSERLARIKERSDEDFELQLSLWKLDSRIKLHVARLSVSRNSGDSGLFEPLEKLLAERVLIRRKIYEQEREKVQKRLDRIDESLEALSDIDKAVARELSGYQKLKPPSRRQPRPKPKPARKSLDRQK